MTAREATVSVVRRNTVPGGLKYDYNESELKIVKEMVKEAVDLAVNGFDKIIMPGDRVVLKPNVLFPVDIKWGICTDPRVVEAVIHLIHEAVSPVKIFVAENAAMGTSTMASFRGAGLVKAAERAGAELIPLEETFAVEVHIPKAKFWVGGENPLVFKPILDADVVINLPKMKTHFMTSQVTLGMKNLNGIIPYGPENNYTKQQQTGHGIDVDQKFVDLYRCVKPNLTILDGLIAMEGQGPFAGDLVNMNLVLASSDGVALDAVASAIMGYEPMVEIGMVRIAHHEGLGIGDIDQIEIKGEAISDVKRSFKRSSWDAVGVYSNMQVYNKGSCPGCTVIVRTVGDYIRKMEKIGLVSEGTLEKTGNQIYLLGKGPFPSPGRIQDGKVFIIGDCVPEDVVKLFRDERKAAYLPGCPRMQAWMPIADQLLPSLGLEKWPSWVE